MNTTPSARTSLPSLLLALLLLIPGAALLAQNPLSNEDTQELIKKLQAYRAKSPALSADFKEEKTTHLLNKPIKSEGTLAFQSPNKFRREITGASPSTTVSDGATLWIYYPNFKEVEIYTLGLRAQFDDAIAALTAGLNFDEVTDFYTVQIYADGAGHRLLLKPKTQGIKRVLISITVWINRDFQIQRSEALLPKGDRVSTLYENQRSAPVPAERFEFSVPAGVHTSRPMGQ